MRIKVTRPKYERRGLCYASDLTEAEWRVTGPSSPPQKAFGTPVRARPIED